MSSEVKFNTYVIVRASKARDGGIALDRARIEDVRVQDALRALYKTLGLNVLSVGVEDGHETCEDD